MKQRILFIDRDGTILREPEDEQIDSYDKFEFLPGVITALSFLVRHTDYKLVLVSNQAGLGTDSYPEADFWPTHNLMLDILKGEVVSIEIVNDFHNLCFVDFLCHINLPFLFLFYGCDELFITCYIA
jgi:imidazoleglycerol-phosphate dehydratase/histidinol-phosphatase